MDTNEGCHKEKGPATWQIHVEAIGKQRVVNAHLLPSILTIRSNTHRSLVVTLHTLPYNLSFRELARDDKMTVLRKQE